MLKTSVVVSSPDRQNKNCLEPMAPYAPPSRANAASDFRAPEVADHKRCQSELMYVKGRGSDLPCEFCWSRQHESCMNFAELVILLSNSKSSFLGINSDTVPSNITFSPDERDSLRGRSKVPYMELSLELS